MPEMGLPSNRQPYLLDIEMTPEQRARTLAGINKALAAIEDNSPLTQEEIAEHNRLVAREMARHAERKSAQSDLGID